MENPKCPYCGEEMEMRFRHRPDGTIWKGIVDPREIPYDAVVTYVDDYYYYCRNCKVNTPYRSTPKEAFAAAMKRERAKGEWGKPVWGRDYLDRVIIIGPECSICHEKSEFPTRFCPHCGAEMEGEDE